MPNQEMYSMVSDQVLTGLKNVPYFSEVPGDALQNLAYSAVKKSYPKNAVLINEGEEAGSLFIILNGKVQIYLSDESGRTVTLAIQESGSFFGELSLLDGEPRSASVITLEPTTCVLIPSEAFLSWLKTQPDSAVRIIRSLTRRIRNLNESVRGLALSDVYGRLVKALNSLAVPCDGGWIIENKPRHQDLANVVGCSREMISRIMRDLVRGGYVSVDSKALRLNRRLPPSW
jgi:CRP/FNR family cyclic AMP-dependent transcriptional regulator